PLTPGYPVSPLWGVIIKRTAKSLGTQASCLRKAGWKPANPGAGKMPAFPEVPSISIHFELEQCSSLGVIMNVICEKV
ncbi:MAG: hypothetical protein FWC43_14855, partial [Planctomycetaceae bacterium]|nr:hypothetical protein [Planctomycetaceae bacterium]